MKEISKKRRALHFKQHHLDRLALDFDVYLRENSSYSISGSDYGELFYFPKANKVHIAESNTWESNGWEFILKNLLNQ